MAYSNEAAPTLDQGPFTRVVECPGPLAEPIQSPAEEMRINAARAYLINNTQIIEHSG